ncbi:hypothetical protein SAMN05444722_1860 [Rhodovulum sp. ES.010]|uniref:hypothetical protein n=1 Tax=Rhodovulum sp. ES.010 TaxID=1882821 RepID=UPI000925B0B0|nr:hypothetical protein [Rhodovulum sp. ES.010]SIO39463.1 hypothetical protein SAMN05444722_1860 [Rhodovulum sp. ES.010]
MEPDPCGGILLPEPSSADRDVALHSKGHFSGHLVLGDGPGRVLLFESHLEMQTALILMARPDVRDLRDQVEVSWTDERGEDCSHYFDFLATMVNGNRIAIAVKASKYLDSEFLEKISAAAAEAVPEIADKVRVFTERDLDPVEVHNAALFHSVRHPDPEADTVAVAVTSDLVGAARLDELTDEIGMGARGLRALIRQVARHRLHLARHERITPWSLIKPMELCR